MDESVFFLFKALLDKRLLGESKKEKGCKKWNQRFTIPFSLIAAWEKISKPVALWVVNFPCCFRGLSGPLQPANAHYFANLKSWKTSDVSKLYSHETLHKKWSFTLRISSGNWNFNFCAVKEAAIWAKKQILFLDNATCHSESMID